MTAKTKKTAMKEAKTGECVFQYSGVVLSRLILGSKQTIVRNCSSFSRSPEPCILSVSFIFIMRIDPAVAKFLTDILEEYKDSPTGKVLL